MTDRLPRIRKGAKIIVRAEEQMVSKHRANCSRGFYGRRSERVPRLSSSRMVLESLELLQNSPENGQVVEEATSGYQPGELLQTQYSVDLNDTSEDDF